MKLAKTGIGQVLLKRQGGRCAYCYRLLRPVDVTIDHVIPWSEGGSEDPSNLAAACRECNADKGNLSVTHWKRWRGDALRARIRLSLWKMGLILKRPRS